MLLPKSLVSNNTEDAIYRMAADGVLPIDDEEDAAGVKIQNIRLLNVNMGQYITELSNLKEAIKLEARELVDMNAQRYGQIAQSAWSFYYTNCCCTIKYWFCCNIPNV